MYQFYLTIVMYGVQYCKRGNIRGIFADFAVFEQPATQFHENVSARKIFAFCMHILYT